MMGKKKVIKEKGSIIKWLLFIILAVALASFFFDFSIQELVEDEQTQNNYHYVMEQLQKVNEKIRESEVLQYLWNDVFKDMIWSNFVGDLEHLKNGEETLFESFAPQIQVDTENEQKTES